MTELLNGRHFEGGAAGNGGATYRTVALRLRCYIIPHPTIYLPPEFEANWPKNDRVIERAPFRGWSRLKWRRGATYGAVALRRRCYIIPHPTIWLVLEFEENRLKNDRVIE